MGIGLPSNPGRSLLTITNNAEIDARAEAEAQRIAGIPKREEIASALAEHVQKQYFVAWQAKETTGVTERLIDALRRRRGEYSPEKKAEIQAMGGTELYSKDTEIKCNAAEAIITDVMMPFGDKVWGVSPSPVPSLPMNLREHIVESTLRQVAMQVAAGGELPAEGEIMQFAQNLVEVVEEEIRDEAKDRCDRLYDTMQDQLHDMSWRQIFADFRSNVVTFGTGLLKGPTVHNTKRMTWKGFDYVPEEQLGLRVSAPSPLDFFPSPQSVKPDDGYCVERLRVSGKALSKFKKVTYYQESEINELLRDRPRGYVEQIPSDQVRATQQEHSDPTQNLSGLYELLEYWGAVQGQDLEDWGLKGLRPIEFYDVQVITCAKKIIKVMPNPDPLGRMPYFRACYKRLVGSFWGNGVPHLISDSQDLANGAIRAIANNMGFASGPMVAIDTTRLPPEAKLESIHPWQLFQFENPAGMPGDPIKFFQPDSNVGELMIIYNRAVQKMDDESGIPAYQYGNEKVGGAGRTAHGLAMLMNASARGIKQVMYEIDTYALEPFIERLFAWNMQYNPDESIKGDAQIITYGATRMLLQDMKQARVAEFTDRTANPIDMQILGLEGRAKLLKKNAELLDVDIEEIIPDGAALMRRLKQQQSGGELGVGLDQFSQGGQNTMGSTPKQENTLMAA